MSQHPNTHKVARHLNLPRIAEPAVSDILWANERALAGLRGTLRDRLVAGQVTSRSSI